MLAALQGRMSPRRMDRYPRQLRNVIRHSTPRRFFNLLLVELEMKLGRTKLWGRPYIAFVDPINLCNLRCPLCPTGTNELMRAQGTMDLHLFQHTIDEVAPWAFEITLYNWGEPLLHKNIFEMIRYAASKNLATSISSNFNRLRPGDIDRLIDSGLEYLSVSIDGASPETYAHYRRRGDFDTVLHNVRSLIERREARGARHPIVEWQFIVMKHNEHEIDRARELAAEVGVDLISFVPVAMPFDFSPERKVELAPQWFSSLPGFRHADAATGWTVTKGPWRRWFSWGRQYRRQPASDERPPTAAGETAPRVFQSRCYHLYRSITVNPGGGVAPCCIVYDEQADTGNIREGVGNLWNNESYQSARAEFNARESPTLETICTGCHIFAKPARLQEPVRRRSGSANGIPLPMVDAANLVGAALGRDGATVTLPSEGGDA